MARGELKKLSSLFDKYKERLVAPEGSVIDAFVEVVRDLFEFEVNRDKIRYNPTTKTLSIVGMGILRSEVKKREQEVFDHLRGRLGDKSAPKHII
ncbi:hypothetical protein A2837_03065 [Candidatus Kaiserbacteria bacterium RIFCSPHIGHO2_01_FULL_46_22]|uniref:Uncharacterized protein n=1 Tax=Candidatus Kaiserbacteria bacterium RIFCSPHIGHO2_01_FULL_46_22 TaxID=1798475 RepID=A0A1F6BWZ4_9BACT|nr:MAG: hypothetical protein A2837_03065 [Candidatus Kaiserbacteria bacterium RIFCSPHIGHO2_01_FULL_46_22]